MLCMNFYNTWSICSIAAQIGSYHDLDIGLYESRPFFRFSKCSFAFSFQSKITPLLPHLTQCCYGWFKERFLFSQQVRKIKLEIEYRGKGGRKAKYCEKSFFFHKFMKKIVEPLNIAIEVFGWRKFSPKICVSNYFWELVILNKNPTLTHCFRSGF